VWLSLPRKSRYPSRYSNLNHPLKKDWSIFRRVGKIGVKRLLASSCLFARMEQLCPHWKDFHEIWYLRIFFLKSVLKVQIWLKYDKNNWYFTWIECAFMIISHWEWEMFQKKVVEEITTHILFSITFLLKSCRLWDNVGKRGRVGQAVSDNLLLSWKITIYMSYK